MTQLDDLFLSVQKPGRYIGGEWNAVRKERRDDRVSFLLAFPDVYDVGMSYLGMKILYGVLNERDDCVCERVFAPWHDCEAFLRTKGLELFSLESRTPMKKFDVVGFSLSYELNYTNMVNMLDLGGIPVFSRERTDADPLVIAGGPSSFNPEPVAAFVDAFLIGDGEEAMGEIVTCIAATRGSPRADRLKALASIGGIYVPSLYDISYNDDGTIRSMAPRDGACAKIRKRVVADLDLAYYPVRQIVPHIQTVHDRISIEILRGCKHACRFCLSGAVYRPPRERSMETILRLARETYEATGYEEISLLSLSTGDHSKIREIVSAVNAMFRAKGVSVSMPSLRIRDLLKELPVLLSQVRKAGLTFAPEAGTVCMRRFINKEIDIDDLFSVAEESFKAGWNRLKLYFMIGFPQETDADIAAIADIVQRLADLGRTAKRHTSIAASINAFVPKPHTPFQSYPMERLDLLVAKRAALRGLVKRRSVELDFNPFERARIEAVFSRGDRRLSQVVYDAWKKGARFDGWSDSFSYSRWLDAFAQNGIDPDFYAHRQAAEGEIMPWDMIDVVHHAQGRGAQPAGLI